MKYLILHEKRTGYTTVMVFGNQVIHALAAKGIRDTHTVISAGFCSLDITGEWCVHGESDSLNLKSQLTDATVLTLALCHGLEGQDLNNALLYQSLKKNKEATP